MKAIDVFTEVKNEFSETMAADVLVIVGILMATKPKTKELLGETSFNDRVKAKARKVLWELIDHDFEFAFRITMALNEFKGRRALQGLGGCVVMSLKEIVERGEK